MLADNAWNCTCPCHRQPQYLPHRKPCCEIYAQNEPIATPIEVFSDSTEHPSKTDHAPDTTPLLRDVRYRAEARRLAQVAYWDAVKRAHAAGVPPGQIGVAAGVTGACIRMQLKRTANR